jgi:hypothetical protein
MLSGYPNIRPEDSDLRAASGVSEEGEYDEEEGEAEGGGGCYQGWTQCPCSERRGGEEYPEGISLTWKFYTGTFSYQYSERSKSVGASYGSPQHELSNLCALLLGVIITFI